MKHLCHIVMLLTILTVSCKKDASKNQKTDLGKNKSVYKIFLDSLDGLSRDQLPDAIAGFAGYHTAANLNLSQSKSPEIPKNIKTLDDASDAATIWAQQSAVMLYTPNLSTFPVGIDNNYGYFYDCYQNTFMGVYGCWELPTKIMKWTMVHNSFNLWDLISHEQFAGSNCSNFSNCFLYGVKHKFSALTGVTSLISWQEKLIDCQISSKGYAAYTHIEGLITFSYKIYTYTKDLDVVKYWTYDEIF